VCKISGAGAPCEFLDLSSRSSSSSFLPLLRRWVPDAVAHSLAQSVAVVRGWSRRSTKLRSSGSVQGTLSSTFHELTIPRTSLCFNLWSLESGRRKEDDTRPGSRRDSAVLFLANPIRSDPLGRGIGYTWDLKTARHREQTKISCDLDLLSHRFEKIASVLNVCASSRAPRRSSPRADPPSTSSGSGPVHRVARSTVQRGGKRVFFREPSIRVHFPNSPLRFFFV